MSLYEYDLYLIREFDQGELLDEIIKSGLLKPIDNEEALILEKISCFFREVINQVVPSCPIRIVKLELDDVQLEKFLQYNPQIFISWLEQLFKQHNIAYAFIEDSQYSSYHETEGITSRMVFEQIGHLIEMGTVEIVHPVMFFAERLGNGKVCEMAKKASLYTIYEIPETGCMLLLLRGSIDSNHIEILDPGSIYPILRHNFNTK